MTFARAAAYLEQGFSCGMEVGFVGLRLDEMAVS